jgi:GntR family transcriptional regulator/MocR family aminotransferase
VDLLVAVDPAAEAPLHRQVYEGIRSAILTGRLRPGDRLPATRALAGQLALSRQTITEAYEQLRTEGYIHGRQGAGTFVAPDVPEDYLLSPSAPERALPGDDELRLSAWGSRVAHVASWPPDRDVTAPFDLRPHRVALDAFPWEAWSAAVDRAARVRENLSDFAPAAGHWGLRELIAAHVGRYRAVTCSPESVVVVNG